METTPYDQVRYPGKFYPQASADRLATLGRLCGLASALPARCRLLELGCGDGGHLIPQALAFPQARFVGIDLAATAIAEGRQALAALGLDNLELRVGDIGEVDPGPEPFDFIVAHGVLSWVPATVRQRLMDLCARCLAPQGVAYISYSALPGGYLRHVPRDLMRFHTRAIADPQQRPRAAREAVDFMLAAVPGQAFTRELIEREMAGFEGKDYFLLHDLLAEDNEPLYFLDFIDAATACGLQYLAEAEFGAMSTAAYPGPVRRRLEAMPRLEREQYIDFLQLRRFRQTLLCRQGLVVDPAVTEPRLDGLWLSTRALPACPDAEPHAAAALEFRHPYQGSFRAAEPLAKALLCALAAGDPRGMRYADASAAVARALQGPAPEAAARLAPAAPLLPALLALYARDLVEIHAARWTHATAVGERPRASPYVRRLAERGAPVVNGAHGTFLLPTPMLRRLVALLDGTRDAAELLEALVAASPPDEREALSPESLQRRLLLLAQNALLVD
ncbi:MAG: class I SAM-dependent methyltransferase [Burkholderiales bacterium]|nr:class I SAM-dependent methyltransferase [Burkholderiales bacterium]MDE1927696.1 class I SAM-dependent methyltransferase [Burkholderiales bacterium]MDE2502101.1 class I SAM-dependent methyltransferase [Burkholderiales bacterium]